MRITIDIDEDTLREVMKFTGETKKGPAVTKAAMEFLRREMAVDYGKRVMAGDYADYPLSNDEIEADDR